MSNDFEPVKKGPAGVLPAGMVTVDADGRLHFPQRTFKMLDRPTAISVYTNGKEAAFEVANRGNREENNCYLVTNREQDGYVHFKRIVNALDIPEGRHTIEYNEDDDLWILKVDE